jgi:hypothetical protein
MIIENIFDIDDVLRIEQEVIQLLGLDLPSEPYFKEPVALHLLAQWRQDSSDTRILSYCFPLVKSLMVKHRKLLSTVKLEPEEIFNLIVIRLAETLPNYTEDRGRLFTYVTLYATYRILNFPYQVSKMDRCSLPLEDDWDCPTSDGPFHQLADFKAMLTKLSLISGKTDCRILRAILLVLDDPREYRRIHNQSGLILAVSRHCQLPSLLVERYYQILLDRYNHSVVD